MLKWLFTTLLALIVLSLAMPALARLLGIGRIPGDMRFTVGGKDIFLPLASTLLLGFIAWVVGRFL